jgi:hypothetical protein
VIVSDTFATERFRERQRLLKRITDVMRFRFDPVRLMGSLAYGIPDAFSDLDIWLVADDAEIPSLLASRMRSFVAIGKVGSVWERPRFAPKGGKHSIVLYRTPAGPIGADLFVCPYSEDKAYRDFYLGRREASDFLFENAPDDVSTGERVSYLCSACQFTIKLISRNKLDLAYEWLAQRYTDTRRHYLTNMKPCRAMASASELILHVIANVALYASVRQRQLLREQAALLKCAEEVRSR